MTATAEQRRYRLRLLEHLPVALMAVHRDLQARRR
jgi:hypothetical protein